MNFCNLCGEELVLTIPENDDRERYVCTDCGHIHYQNPRIIVCTVPVHEDKVLLCKRAIEPRYGLWTLPGGFMENDETTHEGALRETLEEACARVELMDIYSLYNLPHINQVHLFFRAKLLDLNFAAGTESLDVKLFTEDEIPWQHIAFIPVLETLKHFFQDRVNNTFPMHCAEVVIETDSQKRTVRNY
ncbi:MAG: NUDIX hydrolase [Pseudohongiellaceae bacterium]|jgi:ADP-ribose pyrophosphatase YjhB (NUDIX family)